MEIEFLRYFYHFEPLILTKISQFKSLEIWDFELRKKITE